MDLGLPSPFADPMGRSSALIIVSLLERLVNCKPTQAAVPGESALPASLESLRIVVQQRVESRPISLAPVLLLPRLRRFEWSAEMAAPAAVDAASLPVPADLPLLPTLGSMRRLCVFRWEPSGQSIRNSIEYTVSRSWAPVTGVVRAGVQQRRNSRERIRQRQALRAMLAERTNLVAQSARPPSPFVPLLIDLPGLNASWDALECMDPQPVSLLSARDADHRSVSRAQQAALDDQAATDHEQAEQRAHRNKVEKAAAADPTAKPKKKKKY